MPHFPIKNKCVNNGFIELFDDEELLHHLLKVLRVKTGEKVKFIDENKIVYTSEIKNIEKKSLSAKIISSNKPTDF